MRVNMPRYFRMDVLCVILGRPIADVWATEIDDCQRRINYGKCGKKAAKEDEKT